MAVAYAALASEIDDKKNMLWVDGKLRVSKSDVIIGVSHMTHVKITVTKHFSWKSFTRE